MVWHHSLLLMNSFNKTEAAVFSCRLCFLRAFPFISLFLTSGDTGWPSSFTYEGIRNFHSPRGILSTDKLDLAHILQQFLQYVPLSFHCIGEHSTNQLQLFLKQTNSLNFVRYSKHNLSLRFSGNFYQYNEIFKKKKVYTTFYFILQTHIRII